MIIKIHNGEAYGTLCYYISDMYLNVHLNGFVFDNLIKQYNLEYSVYDDFYEYKCYVKMHGSITNMLRFRNTLKHLYNLIDLF